MSLTTIFSITILFLGLTSSTYIHFFLIRTTPLSGQTLFNDCRSTNAELLYKHFQVTAGFHKTTKTDKIGIGIKNQLMQIPQINTTGIDSGMASFFVNFNTK